MRVCSKCEIDKPTTDFYVKDSKSGRLHTQCKECYKEHRKTYYAVHYEKYKEEYRTRARAQRAKLTNEYHTNILEYLSVRACVICGEDDIRVLEFDHINPSKKSFTISKAVQLGHPWKRTIVEISKCRVLCANCHKKHTATQANWYRSR